MDFEKIKDFILEKKIYVILTGIAVGVFIYFKGINANDVVNNSAIMGSSDISFSDRTSSPNVSSVMMQSSDQPTKVVCDISGAVKNEGVYTLKNGSRLADLIDAAGGLTKRAQLKAINRSMILNDQDKVYVPYKGEKVEMAATANGNSLNSSTSSGAGATSSSPMGDKINLNTASATDLQKLNGIGEKKAEQIIAYRDQNGGFKSIDDLKNVSGIGDKTFETLKDQITI